MSQGWQRIGVIAPGGTVFNITHDIEDRLWIATGAGIFCRGEGAWQPLPKGQPLSQLNTLACAGNTLIAGGVGQIVYSSDGGDTWHQSRAQGLNAPVACLVASPSFEYDRVVLAGTDGEGILRSTDGGKNWRFANFGLQDFSVLALATAPEWDRREIAFAATARGLYHTPNAGRAWKRSDVGMENTVVQLIAVSPNFAEDGTVFAGTEEKGLYRSTDGGKTWHPWGQGLGMADDNVPINAFWLHPDFPDQPVCLVGTGDGRLFRSSDAGASWTSVVAGDAPILSLADVRGCIYAGLHDQGLLISSDDGQSWAHDQHLAARAVTRLVGGAGSRLYAFGPLEGVWQSSDAGRSWSGIRDLNDAIPIYALGASPQEQRPCLLVGTGRGLLRSEDDGQSWQIAMEGVEVTTVIFSTQFAQDSRAWAGTGAGELLASSDGAHTWKQLKSPEPGAPVVSLVNWPRSRGSDLLVAGTFNLAAQQLSLWRSADGGYTWSRWMQEVVDWPAVHLGPASKDGDGVVVCAGRMCWRFSGGRRHVVLETEASVARLLYVPSTSDLIVLTPGQVLHSSDGEEWSSFDEGLESQPLIDVALPASDGRVIYGLGAGGSVWWRT